MGHRRRVFCYAAVILALTNTGRAATWTAVNNGLSSVAVNLNSIVIAPGQSSTIYARTTGTDGIGGIFKTTDGAGTWKAISSLVGVNFLVVDPTVQTTLYAVTAHGVFKSADGGQSWIGAGNGLSGAYVNSLVIDPSSPSKLYAVAGTSIFKSTDGASSWNSLNASIPTGAYITSLVIDPTNSARLYASGSFSQNFQPPSAGLLISTDEGASWKITNNGLAANSTVASLTIGPGTPSVLYEVANANGFGGSSQPIILESKDGAATWGTLNTGLPSGVDIRSLIIAPGNSSTLYLAVDFDVAEAGGILKSTDGGATWSAIKTDLPANTPIDGLVIDPVSSSTVYVVSSHTLLKSLDGGASWTTSTAGLAAISTPSLTVSPVDASTLYTGAGNNVFKSADGGANWTNLFAFQLFASSTTSFFPSFFPDGSPTYPISLLADASNPNVLYASTTRGNGCFFSDNLLFKSTDGGMSWNNNISPNDSGCLLGAGFGASAGLKAMDPTDPNTIYAAEADDGDGFWELLRSSDGGATWNSVGDFPGNLQTGVWALAIDPSAHTTLYAGLDDVPFYADDGSSTPGMGGVFKSMDGGATWNTSGLSGAAVNLLAIDSAQPNVLYAITEGHYASPFGFREIFKTNDGGATWSPIHNGLEGLIAAGSNITAVVIDPGNSNNVYLGVSGGGVFKSSDGGATWSSFNDGLGNLDVRVLSVGPGHRLYAGTSGGVFRIDDVN